MPESQTLFIQYNRYESDSTHHFADVARQALGEADSHPVKHVVIDLRWNGGGDSTVIKPLKSGLASRLKSTGRIYELIGPGTFSSAVDNAGQLENCPQSSLVNLQEGCPMGMARSARSRFRIQSS